MKLYVPNKISYPCVRLINGDIIRAYHTQPQINTTTYYTDYYIKSDYISTTGYETYSTWSVLPQCVSQSELTDTIYYRYDFDKILIIFLILTIITIIIPLKIFFKLFKKGGL